MLAQEALSVGVQPMVLLIAFDERITKYRHPTPTNKTLTYRT